MKYETNRFTCLYKASPACHCEECEAELCTGETRLAKTEISDYEVKLMTGLSENNSKTQAKDVEQSSNEDWTATLPTVARSDEKCAFTLAETLIVIVVLGIIATLTIPALVNKNKESVAKTKVRKAMAAYESALNKMIIENDLKSDDTLTAWAGDADSGCANSTNYFKKVQGDGCIFKTSDGIWWNISDIERPVISFKEINADNAATITTNANNANDKTAFVLVGRFGTDGSLRVDDLAYETTGNNADQNSDTQVKKLYSFLGLYKDSSSGGGQTVSCDEDDIVCRFKNGYVFEDFPECNENNYQKCIACSDIDEGLGKECILYQNGSYIGAYSTHIDFDNNGNPYKTSDNFQDSNDIAYGKWWSLDDNENVYFAGYYKENNGDEYSYCEVIYNPDGSIQTQEGDGCE